MSAATRLFALLTYRPVILPDYTDVELRVPADARCSAWVSFDGKDRQELQPGNQLSSLECADATSHRSQVSAQRL